MRNSLFALLKHSLVRYIFVGGFSYSIELAAIFSLQLMGFNELLSVGVAFWIGLVISFLLQKLIAFENREKKVHHLAYQSLSYIALVVFNYGFTLAFVGLTSYLLGLYLSRTIALAITTVWNYFIYSHIIFKHHD